MTTAQRTALVLGAGGFIGSHMVKRLKEEGLWVRAVDLKRPEFSPSPADEFILGDLQSMECCSAVLDRSFDEIYQFAADMGGAGYVFTGDNDADIMRNSAMINMNVAGLAAQHGCGRLFYSSSACIYPQHNQDDPTSPQCAEHTAYPADPDSEYGWEKLFSERLYLSFARNHELPVRIARYHNIFGPEGTWTGGREKAPAALCRKVAEATGGRIEVWGPGIQTRSFLYIDECLEATLRLTRSEFAGPVNIGSEQMVSINELAMEIAGIAGKDIAVDNVPGPIGVNGRNSDNTLIREKLGWAPSSTLRAGLEQTYAWIEQKVRAHAA
jgi:nucleoside-diphosphate-sugar epimerase